MTPRSTVLITGASTGIGRVAAKALAEKGFRVFAGVRKPADAEAVAADHARIQPVILDVTNGEQIAAARAHIDEQVPEGLWGLVNNAGIVVSSPIEFVPLDELRRQFEVNVTGQVAATQAFLPSIRRGKGRIVFTGSSSGYFTMPYIGPYAASKYAIEAIGDALRRELHPWGIPVSIIQPGAIKTPIWEKSESAADDILEGLPEQAHELYGDRIARVRELVQRQSENAAPAETVAKAIIKALTARQPKARYKVGGDARVQRLFSLLPARWMDAMLAKVFSPEHKLPS